MAVMDPALHEGYERRGGCSAATIRRTTSPRAGSRPSCARHARALRLRPHRRPDRRRPAPPGDARGPPRGAGRLGGGADAGAQSRQPIVRALADAAARHRLPLGELRTYMRSMRIDCAPVRIASWEELVAYMDGSAGSVGRIMAALLGVPAGHHADLGRLGIAFQLANFIRDVREDTRLDRDLPARRGPRALRGQRGGPARAERHARGARAARPRGRARPRACSPPRAPRSPPRPRRCAPACASPTGLYGRMLDRVEATGFDVLGRKTGVRVWHIPGAALEALR